MLEERGAGLEPGRPSALTRFFSFAPPVAVAPIFLILVNSVKSRQGDFQDALRPADACHLGPGRLPDGAGAARTSNCTFSTACSSPWWRWRFIFAVQFRWRRSPLAEYRFFRQRFFGPVFRPRHHDSDSAGHSLDFTTHENTRPYRHALGTCVRVRRGGDSAGSLHPHAVYGAGAGGR